MELSDLMKNISNNTIPKYMIWFGEEQKILDMYLKHISLSYKPIYCETVQSVLTKIRMKSLDKSPKVYIVNEDEEYRKNENAWKIVKETIEKSNNILVLRYYNVNKKLKFYTQQKESFTEFVHLQTEILTQYIQKEMELSTYNCKKLCSMCNNDYGRILLELDKLKHMDSTLTPDGNFDVLVSDGGIYSDIGDITFELTNAILGGYTDTAIKKLNEAKRKNEPAIMIASILYNGFRNLLAYKGLGKDKKDAGKRTGLTGWQIKQCIDFNDGYNIQEVIRNMLFCQRVESGIKQGLLDEEIALEYLVLGCLR